MKKFVEILMFVGGGCSTQISKKEDYELNPINVLKKKGFVPELWALEREGEKKEGFYEGIKVRRFKNTFSLLWHLFLDKDVELVHAHGRPNPSSLLSPLSLKRCILTCHTYELGSSNLIKNFSLFFMGMFCRIVTLTPHERNLYLKEGLGKEKVVLLPHAIDYEFFSSRPSNLDKIRKKYCINKGDFVLISVANFRKFKNLDVILSAFALFNKKVKNSKFFVVGIDQTKNPRYKEQGTKRYSEVNDVGDIIKREKISKNVIFTGGIDYKKVRELLYISDIFVNSSDPEAMGLAVYEAASAGLPLCLSKIGSFTSVFKDMALYNKPRDEKALAENYMGYYKNPKLRKKLGSKLKNYLKRWGYPVFIKKLDKFYSDALK